MMDKTFFINNRHELQSKLGDDLVVVLTANTRMQLVGDVAAPFQQESNFWYLTGIDHPDCRVIFTQSKSWLVAPLTSEVEEVFDGKMKISEAKNISGVDEVIDEAKARQLLVSLSKSYQKVATLESGPNLTRYNFFQNPAGDELLRELKKVFKKVKNIRSDLLHLRAVKQPMELAAIKDAVNLTTDTFELAKKSLKSFRHEYELEAIFTYEFRRQNAQHAYDPIVAGSINACTLHYDKNSSPLNDGSLVLIDIGARKAGYLADLTRTWAIGKPAKRQAQIHQELAQAHHDIVQLLRPGLSLASYQDLSDDIMKRALKALGLLGEATNYRRYFPHAISHGLGIDVHDSFGGHKEFVPGMVLTVEPGIYIPEESIGMRLEDNILITESGHENLSGRLALEL